MSMDSNGTATVLGMTFDPKDRTVLIRYSILNLFVNSFMPLPLAGPMVVVASLLYGIVGGLAVNIVSSILGACLSFWTTRFACRPCFVRALGRYSQQWAAVDAALTAEGYQIALLIRIAPVSPMVLSNVLLALTSISLWTYFWTTFVGLLPANLPYAYGAQLGMSLYDCTVKPIGVGGIQLGVWAHVSCAVGKVGWTYAQCSAQSSAYRA